jgi:hypothetical protein
MKFNYKRKNVKKLKKWLGKRELIKFVSILIVNDYFRAERKAAECSENRVDAQEVSSQQNAINGKINMENVSNWNESNVRNFLMKHNLTTMIPLCNGINGEELSNLYAMCKANPTAMYRSLRFELLHGYHRILPISTFLHFMSRTRVICDNELSSNAHTMNRTHDEHFPNNE